ncbi:hypothetical protein L2E82_45860 [Cichorium intybus]|uniref:Uncharacterized protein n=1 Tax=Cichorium intybus TaxID=13427 RepID=A0ACB8ZU14_CICIN|nr:hypothetical protein L2E82_45860 [Cichorium intybus]
MNACGYFFSSLIHMICLCVDVFLSLDSSLIITEMGTFGPLYLDHIVKKDLGVSRTWMGLRANSREIVSEIDESIFEDISEDTLLGLVDDYVGTRLGLVDDCADDEI